MLIIQMRAIQYKTWECVGYTNEKNRQRAITEKLGGNGCGRQLTSTGTRTFVLSVKNIILEKI